MRVLLVGFMGAGKSTVGRGVARALGWRFVDVDDDVEADAGCTIGEIFERFGEDHFRRLEAQAAGRQLSEERVVIATGGGWAAQPGAMQQIPPSTATVWLQVSAEEAVRRTSRGPAVRPLLANAGPGRSAGNDVKKLLEDRAAHYSLAEWRVDTEGSTVEDVTAHILEIVAKNESETGTE